MLLENTGGTTFYFSLVCCWAVFRRGRALPSLPLQYYLNRTVTQLQHEVGLQSYLMSPESAAFPAAAFPNLSNVVSSVGRPMELSALFGPIIILEEDRFVPE